MPKLVDLTGQQFGRLTVVSLMEDYPYGKPHWLCKCECGNTVNVAGTHLKTGHSQSCGCRAKDVCGDRARSHGKTNTPEHMAWKGMRNRCYNKNEPGYPNYGGRGITVCAQWRDSFEQFLSDMGERPSSKYSLDRIDVNGDYEPSNCRWATQSQQQNNKQTNVYLEYKGERLTLAQWSKKLGLRHGLIRDRLKRGWSVEKAMSTQVRKQR